jgi:hypothetical protein
MRGRGEGPDPGLNDRLHHTSLSVFTRRRRTSLLTDRRRTGQVFAAVLSKER